MSLTCINQSLIVTFFGNDRLITYLSFIRGKIQNFFLLLLTGILSLSTEEWVSVD